MVAGCFTYVVFCKSCRCYRSLALPRAAMGWLVVCGRGIVLNIVRKRAKLIRRIRTVLVGLNGALEILDSQ